MELYEMPVLTERQELISMYSDTYKDAYGIRPRWINFDAMTNAQIEAGIDDHCKEAARQAKADAIFAEQQVEKFKALIQRTIDMGAGDEETALRWLAQNETFYNPQCIEHWVWQQGFLFTDYGTALIKKLCDIVEFELPF